jgi:very-short-patch-repair endonuclease
MVVRRTPVGVFTTEQARAAGWSEAARRRNVAAGRWQRTYRGVYAAGQSSLTPLGRAAAVNLATDGVASHVTAARCHGLWVVDPGEWATVRGDIHRDRRSNLRLHRCDLPAADTVDVVGVRVTTVSRTLADLARQASRLQAVCAIESAVRLQLITPEQFAQLRVHPDRRLRSRARAADPRSESPLETAVRLLLCDAGIDVVPQWQGLDWRDIEVYRIDLAIPLWRIAIECDGTTVHGTLKAAYKDRWRSNRINVDGWQVLRFTWWDVTARPAYVVSTVRNAVTARQATAG